MTVTALAPNRDATSRAARTHALVPAVALLLLHAVLAWRTRVPGLTLAGDDAAYLALARALRETRYVELWTAGAPVHAMYPPAYPGLLALLGATGPDGIAVAVLANILLSTCALAGAALLAARRSPWLAVALLLVCAPNPMLVSLAGRVYSEPFFSALLVGALLLCTTTTLTRRRLLAAATLAVVAALTRSIGVSLLLALLLDLALQRRWRTAGLLGLVSLCTVGAWLGFTLRAPRLAAGWSYVSDALYVPKPAANAAPANAAPATSAPARAEHAPSLPRVLVARVRTQVPGYLTRTIPAALSQPTVPGTPVDNVVGAIILVLAGGAGMAVLARRERLVVLALIAYGGVLVLWPWASGRFLAPVLPLLMLCVLAGLHWLGARAVGPRVGWAAVWSTSAVLALGAGVSMAQRLREVASCERAGDAITAPGCASEVQRAFFTAVDALPAAATEGEPILTAKAPTVYLRRGRQAVRQSEALAIRDPDAFVAWLQARGIRTVLLSRVDIAEWGLAPMLRARCELFRVRLAVGTHAALLELTPAATAVTESSPTANVTIARPPDACRVVRDWADSDWTAEVEQARLSVW